MRIAVIPARGGSKRIPRKNITDFCGQPIIAWSIHAALRCDCFDQVIVSTDDDEIARVAREHGASVPFTRPADISDDHSTTSAVVRHAINYVNSKGDQAVNYACCIYATAPFVESEDILKGLETLSRTACHYVFPVTTFAFPIQRALRITEEAELDMFYPEYMHTRSQDLEQAYHDAGQFYWGRAEAWSSESPIFASHSKAMILPRHRVQDIDTMEDWAQAEAMFKTLQNPKTRFTM